MGLPLLQPYPLLHSEDLGRANQNTLSLDHSLHGYAHSLASKCKLFVAEMGTVGLKANQSQHISSILQLLVMHTENVNIL